MAEVPDWIAAEITSPLENNTKLSQQHVVEVMLAADRPFFSIRQLQERVKPDVGKGTVRNRLDELRDAGVVDAIEYPDSISLYYIDYPESDWPLSPEGKRAIETTSRIDGMSITELLLLRDREGIRALVLAGFHLSVLLIALGLLLGSPLVTAVLTINQQFVNAGLSVFVVSLLLWLAERIARWVRTRDWWIADKSTDVSRSD